MTLMVILLILERGHWGNTNLLMLCSGRGKKDSGCGVLNLFCLHIFQYKNVDIFSNLK